MTLNELTKWYFDTIAPNKLRIQTLEVMTLDIYAHSFAEAQAKAMENTADTIGRAVGDAMGTLM